MQKIKAITLLFVMGVLLTSWSLLNFCITHPLGHKHHHEPGELTPCEIRKQYNGEYPAFMPPMDCQKLTINADNYQLPDEFQVKPSKNTNVVAVILPDLIRWKHNAKPFLLPPDPKCRSAPLISKNTLRGPPAV